MPIDELGSNLREEMAERRKINYIGFGDTAAASEAALGLCPVCFAHMVRFDETMKTCPKGCVKMNIVAEQTR